MDGREARKGANEAWFRDLNERLERRAAERVAVADEFDAICECADEECTARIRLSFADYERVRAHPTMFVVIPGHVDPEIERVVASNDSYRLVEKLGAAGEVAEADDPRHEGRE